MKKLTSILLTTALCLSLSACGSKMDASQQTPTASEAVSSQAETPSLDGEYLAGTWEWQEKMSPDSISKMRSFKLKADGTGKILSFDGDKLESSELTWVIEEHDSWSSVHLFSDENGWNCNYELDGEYLADLTGSDYFAKK
ncbi:MAG: hypothetical protein IJ007_08135 [Oscillospiraceae bacterium]|nr:hypothetical protein [Oscillospiraceae bacterium]